jgi:hypothetical protein
MAATCARCRVVELPKRGISMTGLSHHARYLTKDRFAHAAVSGDWLEHVGVEHVTLGLLACSCKQS